MTDGRERYLDVLRAVALVRVVFYHMFFATWLSFVFPAMGVMFALGGSLMARSLDRSSSGAAVTSRFRRLLPAFWVFGIVVVTAMATQDWPDRPHWTSLLPWLVPLADPPGSEWAEPATTVLWYLVTYLWLVLLSPVALLAYRRRPVLTILTPLGVLGVLAAGSGSAAGSAAGPAALGETLLGDQVGPVVVNVATFGACWVVGFAHRDGALRRMATPLLVTLAGLSLGAGAGWALTHPAEETGYDLNDIPVAQALYCLGFVLLLLRLPVTLEWLPRWPLLDRCVTMLNARAVTIYLWHNPAIAASFVVGDLASVWRLGVPFADVGYFAVALLLLGVTVFAVGRVEDYAAGRRRLPSRTHRHDRPAQPHRHRTAREVPAVVRERWSEE